MELAAPLKEARTFSPQAYLAKVGPERRLPKFPGSHFRINWYLHQHGQMLTEWSQINPDGSELVTAHSNARLDEEGLIRHFAGFWKPF